LNSEAFAMIKQAEKDYSPVELEKRIREFWRKTRAYEKTRQLRAGGQDFYFVDGPPYTTGSIHLGTALNKTIKDTVVRWRRMKGFNVRDQAGFDMHGLPIEVQVEKSLGITNKKEIEEFGIEKFVATCKDFSMGLLKRMTEQFSSLGVWFDWDHPYMTIENYYIEAGWWTIKKAHERGLLYEALRALTWCSRCETALAEAEIEYWDETDPSIYVLFPFRSRPGEGILIWTTTPWTIPANLAVAVHPRLTYARIRFQRDGKSHDVWMLESNVAKVLGEADVQQYQVLERERGEMLVNWEYVHPLESKVPYQKSVSGQSVHRVLLSETVTGENTGVVHIAPGHGPEDFEIGQAHQIPMFSPVDESARFTADAGEYAGKHIKEANAIIVKDLAASGHLLSSGQVTHRYGHCWRCHSPVMYRLTTQWFIKVTEVKNRMLEEIDRIKWTPEWAGASRQHEWTVNLRDWCITRQRFWGTPMPVWRCGSCGTIRVVGSMAELREGSNYTEGMDPHRPWIDKVTFKCPKCAATQTRVRDIIDVWHDAGICSWAQLGYPRVEGEFKRWWPTDWICEAHDQTRGWFNSQLAASVVAFDRSPYESVLMHGWMLGSDGQAMSKSLGNYVEPSEVVQKYGVDSLRLYLMKTKPPWEDVLFNWEEVKNANRSLNILWNVYKFAALYMAMDSFDPQLHSLDSLMKHLRPEDKWLLSRVERLKMTVNTELEGYNLHKACRALDDFILNDLSRWYVRLIRDRIWVEGGDKGKLAAYRTLHEALGSLCRLLAPFAPHVAEAIYQNMEGRFLSVHMCAWPSVNEDLLSGDLEVSMATVQELVELVSQARQEAKMKLRWPLAQIAIKDPSEGARHALTALKDIFTHQANARSIVVLERDQEFEGLKLRVKPDPEAISKVYKASWSKIVTMLQTREPGEVKKAIDKGEYKLGIDGQIVKVQSYMISFERQVPEGVKMIQTPHGTLYLDMRITPEVKAEGFSREIIRRVQQMRKDVDLPVEDFVRTAIRVRGELAELLESQREHIASETRSRFLRMEQNEVNEEYGVEWNVEGETMLIGITPLHMGETIAQFSRVDGITVNKAMALFDAGYKTMAALSQATPQELAAVEGMNEFDVKRIKEHVTKAPLPTLFPCPVCGAMVKVMKGNCWRCGESLEGAALPPQEFVACPSCKSPVRKGAEVCPTCSGPMKERPKLVVPPPVPVHVPVPSPPQAPPKPKLVTELKESSTYLVKESQPGEAYVLFRSALASGKNGICVTRLFPQKVREQYQLAVTPIVWLSNIGKEDSVRPKDLEKLSLLLEQFLSKERGIILLDGIEYLITNNNFLTVLRLVQSLRDQVAVNKATFLLSVNPSTLDSHQLNLLEREVDGVVDLTAPPK